MVMPDQTAVSAADPWARHDRDRLAWAFRAYTRFIESLSPEIRERLAHKDHQAEPYVVVFGKTQVGKTTLLLELMGVLAAQMVRVSRVLRGGQPKGQSATATAMEYRRSSDQRWGLRINEASTEWFDEERDMEVALAHLRQQMEARNLAGQAPCVVFLPIGCFAADASQPAVRMLDLPGDKPANPTEQEHVSAMARKYVPLADLILLVGRGDDLSFLQEGALTLPGIEDWQSAPRRFRIITTYSFTAQSVRELVRQLGKTADVQLYRERLIEQIERSIPLSQDARQPRNFFPLEFGQSWLDAQKQEPIVYERVTPLINALKQQLLAEIHASTTPFARLGAAVDAHIVIVKVREKRLASMHALAATLTTQLKQAQDELANAKTAINQAEKACRRLEEHLKVVTLECLRNDLQDHFRLPNSIDTGDPNESVAGFKVCIQTAKSSLSQCVLNSRPSSAGSGETGPFWRNVQFAADTGQINVILARSFSDLITTLDGYMLNAYWSTGAGSNYQRDVAALRECTDQARLALTKMAKQWWFNAAQEELWEYKRQLITGQARQRSWQQFVEENIPSIRALERTLAEHEQARREFEKRMDAEMQESGRFVNLLDSEYLAELQRRRSLINTDERPISAFIGLVAAVQLEQVRRKVLLHVDQNRRLITPSLTMVSCMTVEQEIERQEREFKELLGRVMRDPLAPIVDSVKELDARLERLETTLQDMREVELSTLSLNADEVNKQFRSLKSIANETPREVGRTVQPLLDRLQAQVEQGKLEIQDFLKEGGKHVDQVAQSVSVQLTEVIDSVSESRRALQSTLQSNVEKIEGSVQSTSVQMQHMASDLGGRVGQQTESSDHAFGRLQDLISQSSARFREDSVAERKQIEQQIATSATSLSEMRTMFAQQTHQLDTLKQQQDAISERIAEQVQRVNQRMGMCFAAAGVVCVGCMGVALFLSGKF